MNLKEKIQFVTNHRFKLSDGNRRALGCYKSMLRNIAADIEAFVAAEKERQAQETAKP